MRRINLFACLLAVPAVGLLACDTGEVGSGGGDDTDRLPQVKCEAALAMSGSFATSISPAPLATDGCVPEGVWTVATTVMDQADCAAVDVASQYVFDVVGAGRDRTIMLRNPPAGAEIQTNIHAGGDGECEFTMESISADPSGNGQYHVLLLKPYTEPGLAPISGTGTFQVWSEHP